MARGGERFPGLWTPDRLQLLGGPLCPEERHPAEEAAQGPQVTLSQPAEGKPFHVGSQSSCPVGPAERMPACYML